MCYGGNTKQVLLFFCVELAELKSWRTWTTAHTPAYPTSNTTQRCWAERNPLWNQDAMQLNTISNILFLPFFSNCLHYHNFPLPLEVRAVTLLLLKQQWYYKKKSQSLQISLRILNENQSLFNLSHSWHPSNHHQQIIAYKFLH